MFVLTLVGLVLYLYVSDVFQMSDLKPFRFAFNFLFLFIVLTVGIGLIQHS
ncbi:MAG: hypothetical protein ABI980_05885 [Nitrospirota bacterium]